jgi:hypothetical protein
MMSWRNGDIFRSAQNLVPVVTVNPSCFAGPRPTRRALEMTNVFFARVIET